MKGETVTVILYILKELRKLMDFLRATRKNVGVINIPQSAMLFYSVFFLLFTSIKLSFYQHDLVKVLNSYSNLFF